MESQKAKAKGRKIGRNRKANGSSTKYKAREMQGRTAKCLRVARALSSGVEQKGWFLSSKGLAMRERV